VRYWDIPEVDHVYTLSDPNYLNYYVFHDLIVLRDTRYGKLWVGTDSGCSCPIPFEHHQFPTDFTEIKSADELRNYAQSWDIYPRADIEAMIEAVFMLSSK